MAKSLYQEYGAEAIPVLQGMMKADPKKFPKDCKVEYKGNHYVITKGKKSMEVGLYCAKEVFEALHLFA